MNLPSGISVQRSGNTYVIYRNKHEEVGGVVVSGTMTDDTQLQPYVNEPQDKNQQVVALVMQQMSDALIEHVARKPEHLRRAPVPPDSLPDGVDAFENKFFTCSKCNQILAKLVFSWESASFEEMEELAKRFDLEASVSKYPIWLLGGPDCNDDRIAKHLTLQLAPQKGEAYWEHPDAMNKRLVELDDQHC